MKVALQAAALQVGQPHTTEAHAVPVGTRRVGIHVDGAAWPEGAALAITLQLSDDGHQWLQRAAIRSGWPLHNNSCHVGVRFKDPTSGPLQVRGQIEALTHELQLAAEIRLE